MIYTILFHPEIASLNFLRYTGAAMQATQQYAPVIPEEMLAKPLSDDLGYYRILRTSTLAAVPGVCCVDC